MTCILQLQVIKNRHGFYQIHWLLIKNQQHRPISVSFRAFDTDNEKALLRTDPSVSTNPFISFILFVQRKMSDDKFKPRAIIPKNLITHETAITFVCGFFRAA